MEPVSITLTNSRPPCQPGCELTTEL